MSNSGATTQDTDVQTKAVSTNERLRYLLFMFVSTGVFGWCMEFVFRTIYNGEVTIPGFLIGPFCSIYGAACLLFSFLCNTKSKLAVFLKAAVLTTLLEFVIYEIFFMAFGVMLWDYTDIPLHLGASVCLPFTLIWGALGMFFVFVLEPFIHKIYDRFKPVVDKTSIVVMAIVVIDFIVSVLIKLNVIEL